MAEAVASQQNLPAKEINSGQPTETAASTVSGTAEKSKEPDVLVVGNSVQRLRERFSRLPRNRQIQLVIAIAAVFAILVAVMLWSTEPSYKVLYGKLSPDAAGQVVEALQQQQIPYRIDEKTGEITVPPDQVHDTRIKLAAKGLPPSSEKGFELLEKDQGFGTSQFMENARYQRALEGELARSVANVQGVEIARVHLAIPKQSVFVRDRREPSASVLVTLKNNGTLSDDQVAAIVYLVASSVPDLKSENVTVVDQKGQMLTKKHLNGDMALSSAQFDYKKKMEQHYVERIERILMPIIGFDGVRAQVDADIDFAVTESTKESFNPDLPSVRSEQTMEEESKGGDVGGVPGALTNQPPGAAASPEKTTPSDGKQPEPPSRKSKRSTFNYELDKTISHTKNAPGIMKKLSVAVVVDNKLVVSPEGAVSHVPLKPEEIERLTGLVKEAVGFSVQRGDTVSVINSAFRSADELPPPPEAPIWQQPWFIDLAKQAAGVLMALVLILMLIKPVLRELAKKEVPPEPEAEPEPVEEEDIGKALLRRRDSMGLTPEDWAMLGLSAEEYEEMLTVLRQMVADDPRLVAQVVKTWVAEDEMQERARREKEKASKNKARA